MHIAMFKKAPNKMPGANEALKAVSALGPGVSAVSAAAYALGFSAALKTLPITTTATWKNTFPIGNPGCPWVRRIVLQHGLPSTHSVDTSHVLYPTQLWPRLLHEACVLRAYFVPFYMMM